jgi:hypothetical protein
MSNKWFKVLKRKKDCVLLYRTETGLYKVRDIENDDVYIGYDVVNAEEAFRNYSIETVRKLRQEEFEKWLKEFAED